MVMTITVMLWILSLSVAVPLVCRSFYYAHIEWLHLPEYTGYTVDQIRSAYDEMMDFCMNGAPFGTGVLRWTRSGMEHFADCAVLFRFDLTVLKVTSVLMLIGGILSVSGLKCRTILARGPLFWAGFVLSAGFLIIAGLASLDFDRAFVTFHHLFFPGKDNWIFNPWEDEIINILPEVFFRNCAILIVSILFILCIVSMIIDLFYYRKIDR